MSRTDLANLQQPEELDVPRIARTAVGVIGRLPQAWARFTTDDWARFQQVVFPRGLAYNPDSGFGTTEVGLMYRLSAEVADAKSPEVDPRGIEPLVSSMPWRRDNRYATGPIERTH